MCWLFSNTEMIINVVSQINFKMIPVIILASCALPPLPSPTRLRRFHCAEWGSLGFKSLSFPTASKLRVCSIFFEACKFGGKSSSLLAGEWLGLESCGLP